MRHEVGFSKTRRTTVGGIRAGDHGGSTDIWERRRQIPEDIEALVLQAVACNHVKGLAGLVINGVPSDFRRANADE